MSDQQNEKALRIAAYIQNKLSPEEREAFKRALSEDDELRVQYVDALMNRAGTDRSEQRAPESTVEENVPESTVGEKVPEATVEENVSEHMVVENVAEPVVEERVPETIVEDQGPGEDVMVGQMDETKRTGGRFLGSRWMVIVTLLLLIGAGVVIYLWTKHQEFWDTKVAANAADSSANKMGKTDTVAAPAAGVDSTKSSANATVVSGNTGWSDSLYAQVYRPYMRGDDPMEVRTYYQDYKAGNYAAVLAAPDSVGAAVGAKKLQLRNYIRLYKGLANLATGNGQEAVAELGNVVLRTNPGDDLYETARWYLAVAWLRRGDVDPSEARSKATALARDISSGYSRYREPAKKLMRSLRGS
jgi:hypothetical protein